MNSRWWRTFFTVPQRKAAAAALGAFCLLSALWWLSHVWYREGLLTKQRALVAEELDPIVNALVAQNQRFNLLRALRAFVEMHQSTSSFADDFHRFARMIAEGGVGFRLLTLAPGGVQRWVHPPEGNETMVGLDMLQDDRPEVRDSVMHAMNSRGLAISDPHEFRLGGLVVAGRLAIYLDGKFWGLANLVLDLPPHLAAAGIVEGMHLKLALRDSRQRVFFGDAAILADSPVTHRIPLPQGGWDLAAVPQRGWSTAIEDNLRLFDGGALSAVILLSVVAYLMAFRDARLALAVDNRTREIDSARRDLERELTERKTLLAQLQAAEERYRHLVDFNPDAVLVNYQGRIVYVNAAALRLFGVARREDLLGRSPLDFIPVALRAEIEARNKNTLETGLPTRLGVQQRTRPDGSIIHVETAAAPVAWEGGTATQVVFRDVTELRKAEAWSRILIENTLDALVSINRRGRIVMFNHAAERMFGYSKVEIAGQKVNVLMAEPYASEHDGYINRYEATREPHSIGRVLTVMAKRKSGEIFPIEIVVTEIEGDDEIPYAALIRDISEKDRMQAQLVESERLAAIGSTAAKIGHELANPVNGMFLTVQLLEQRLGRQMSSPDDQIDATVKRLKSEIGRLNELTRQFREFVRREKYEFRPSLLGPLIDEVIALQEPEFVKQGVQVETLSSPELPAVKMDANKIKQVLLNLFKNAAEAMPKGGKITVEASATESDIILQLTDTGVGIPLDFDAFEPFVTSKPEGTGIGLVVVRQIVTAHGGAISYRSQPGRGTTFRIQLPRN